MDYTAKVVVGAFASSHPKSLLFDVCAVEILHPKLLSIRFSHQNTSLNDLSLLIFSDFDGTQSNMPQSPSPSGADASI